ncbi:MAG: BamA/TamA family outer membrane protein [Ignavibacteria bacterium]
MNHKIIKYLILIFYILLLNFPSIAQEENGNDDNGNVDKFEIDDINITFKAKETYSEGELKALLASRKGDVFDRAVFIQDVERMKKYYFDNGFFDAEVDTNILYNKEDQEITENFIVTEQTRYVYYNIEFNGLDSLYESIKEKIMRPSDRMLRKGRYYSKDSIKLEEARVLNILYNNGYATANSKSPEVLKYETNDKALEGKVNVKLIFEPRLRYVFGPTRITINSRKYNVTTQDIRRELTYSENQVYDKEEVVNSELNLTKISILDNPRIIIEKIDSTNKKIDLAINAIVGDKYNLTPEVFGYYFDNKIFYLGTGISFSDKYFFGGGRILTTRARIYFHSFNDNRFEFVNTVYQPFLFNNRNISGNWNIGVQYRLDEFVNVTQIKNSFSVGYTLPDYTYINRLSSRWDVENSRVILKQDLQVDDTTNIERFDINYFKSVIAFTAAHNSVNSLQFPFKGYFQSYEIEEAGLLGRIVQNLFNTQTVSYVKFSNFNSAYFNLSNNEINVASALAGKISTGIIIEYGDNTFEFNGAEVSADRVPTDTRFLCGGSSSIRGWGARQLGIVKDKSVGGNFIIENSIEHRIRPFLEAENTYLRDLGFATFVDWGNAWSEIGKFKFNEIALAAGGGIRYYTIIGAIRFDVGLKVYDPQPGPRGGSHWLFGKDSHLNDKYNFQFGIGNTF